MSLGCPALGCSRGPTDEVQGTAREVRWPSGSHIGFSPNHFDSYLFPTAGPSPQHPIMHECPTFWLSWATMSEELLWATCVNDMQLFPCC